MKRFLSLLLCAALALSLAACGTNGGASLSQTQSSGAAAIKTATPAMGRWTETDVTPLPCRNFSTPVQMADGTLWCFGTELIGTDKSEYTTKLHKFISKDDGASWQEEAIHWNETLDGAIGNVETAPDGTCIFATYTEDSCKFWLVKAGGEPEELAIVGFAPEYRIGQYYFINHDLIYITRAQDMDANGKMTEPKEALIRLSTQEEVAAVNLANDNFSGVSGAMFGTASDGKQLLHMMFTQTGRTLCALQPDGSNKELLPNATNSQHGTAGATDADGNYYFASEEGVFRIVSGGTLVENILDGATFAFALPDNYVSRLCRTQSGDFLATFNTITQNENGSSDGTTKLYRYHFDTTLPAQSTDGIRVWSLRDSATVRSAIVAYSKEHPDVAVNYAPIRTGSADAMTVEDALRTLNTELLAGTGPDVLLLDDFDYTPYIQKGMLSDLTPALDRAAFVQNVAAPFTKDAATYVMPARFSVPVLFGDAGTVEDLTTLDALQKAVLAAAPRPDINSEDNGYYDALAEKDRFALSFLRSTDLLTFLMETSAPAILENNAVNEENLRKIFAFFKAVCDHSDLGNYRADQTPNGIGMGSNTRDSVVMEDGGVEFSQTGHAKYGYSLMQTTALTENIARYDEKSKEFLPCNLVLRPGLSEGAYLPNTLLAVSAASQKQAEALDFVRTMLSESVQDAYAEDGMPVRQSSLDKMLVRNAGNEKSAYKGDIAALLKTLKTPVLMDSIVFDKISVHAEKLCKGTETLDEAVKGVQNDLAIYLAERQ
ncbi:MAG: extracellular solute-binding protein [Ruthenibacterium sp.]